LVIRAWIHRRRTQVSGATTSAPIRLTRTERRAIAKAKTAISPIPVTADASPISCIISCDNGRKNVALSLMHIPVFVAVDPDQNPMQGPYQLRPVRPALVGAAATR
jgi:Tfp pilus assembly protein FimT